RGEREYPSRRERPVLGGGPDDTRIARRAAESGEIEAYRRGFAARRADAVVERVVDQRQAEHRAGARAQRVAQIAAGEERLAGAHAVAVEIAEEEVLVDGDLLVIEGITAQGR